MSFEDLKEEIRPAAVVDAAGFKFVQQLATDLNTGDIKLPSFPDVVMRIKRAIEQSNCNADRLARIVSTEPALAARLLKVANSALMQRGGKAVNELKTAIARLGHEMLHSTAVSVAVEQIFIGASLKEHRERLRVVWRDAAHVAAISYAIARRCRCGINADEALMAGLLHNVGKLYIIMNAAGHPDFIDHEEVLDLVVDTWHGQVGRAIIEGWGFSDETAAAAAEHMDLERASAGNADMTDIVTMAWLLAREIEGQEISYAGVRAQNRLQLDDEQRGTILRESVDDINALAKALNS